jgi:uncharacterized protein (DUF58 family)
VIDRALGRKTRGRSPSSLRRAIDWGELGPLRLRAREVAEGVFAGLHRSAVRGAGVEFGGHREYVPGDDLRRLDRRSLLRHDRLVVRQFEMETDRALCVLMDASASMGFRGPEAPASKAAFAALVSVALARVALRGGDPVGVAFIGGEPRAIAPTGGLEQFERLVTTFESLSCEADVVSDPQGFDASLDALERMSRRGAIVAVFSDLIDWPSGAANRLGALSARGRVVAVVQTLDPAESTFPFDGTVRLRSPEGDFVVETDGSAARRPYLEALGRMAEEWREAITRRGGRFTTVSTSQSALSVVRWLVDAVR